MCYLHKCGWGWYGRWVKHRDRVQWELFQHKHDFFLFYAILQYHLDYLGNLRYKSTVWTTTHIVNINIFWPWDSATTRAPQVKWIIINDWKLALHPCKNALPPKSLLAKKFNWVNSSLIAPCFSLAMCQLTVQYTVLCNKKIISNRPMFQREGSDLIKKPRYLETFLH